MLRAGEAETSLPKCNPREYRSMGAAAQATGTALGREKR